jgi:hypothetical protein
MKRRKWLTGPSSGQATYSALLRLLRLPACHSGAALAGPSVRLPVGSDRASMKKNGKMLWQDSLMSLWRKTQRDSL